MVDDSNLVVFVAGRYDNISFFSFGYMDGGSISLHIGIAHLSKNQQYFIYKFYLRYIY